MTRDDLFEFIGGQRLAVLATVSAQGRAQSALVGIAASRDLELIFDTVESSRKYGNLVANPAAALVVGCSGEKTLQYEGWARELAGDDLARYQAIYFRTFPDGPSRLAWPGICYFAVRPKWIRFSDYEQKPALIEEFRF